MEVVHDSIGCVSMIQKVDSTGNRDTKGQEQTGSSLDIKVNLESSIGGIASFLESRHALDRGEFPACCRIELVHFHKV